MCPDLLATSRRKEAWKHLGPHQRPGRSCGDGEARKGVSTVCRVWAKPTHYDTLMVNTFFTLLDSWTYIIVGSFHQLNHLESYRKILISD